MTAKPTAVVVRLPLSGEQREKFLFCIDSGEPIDAETSALEAALLAIGTPVAGGELEVVGMRTRDIRSIFTSIWHYSGDIESSGNYETELLVRQSDAQAALAAAQAESVKITEENRQAFCKATEEIIRKAYHLSRNPVIDEEALVFLLTGRQALKGAEA